MTNNPGSARQPRPMFIRRALGGVANRIEGARPARGNSYVVASIMALVILSALFAAYPEIDIAISGAFYRSDKGFWLHYDPLIQFIRILGQSLVLAGLLGSVAVFLVCIGPWRHLLPAGVSARALLYLIVTAVIGPGLIINVLLKTHWDRARPVDTDIFGGEHAFAAAWSGIENCPCNSFASGERYG